MGIILLFNDSEGLTLGRKLKVISDDLFVFIIILHWLNRICSLFK